VDGDDCRGRQPGLGQPVSALIPGVPGGKGNGSSVVLSLLDNNGGSRPLYNLMN
jgi:hypothetical protein